MVALYTHGQWVTLTPEEFAAYDQIRVAAGDDLSRVLLRFAAAGLVDFSAALGPVGGTIWGSLGRDTISGGVGNDDILGLDGRDVLYGGDGDDALNLPFPAVKGAGDTLYGGAGNDGLGLSNNDIFAGGEVYGGMGHDVLYVVPSAIDEHQLHELILTEANGIEAVEGRIVSNPFLSNVIDLGTARFDGTAYLGGTGNLFRAEFGAFDVYGGANDTIYASDLSNAIYGGGEVYAGAGDDILQGCLTVHAGRGDDTVLGDWSGQAFGGAGRDLLIVEGGLSPGGAAVDFVSGEGLGDFERVVVRRAFLSDLDDVVDLVGQGAAANRVESILGLGGDDVIRTGFGRQDLDGGTGADTMAGGQGGDTYHVDDTGDRIIERAHGGQDRVIVHANYRLARDMIRIERFEIAEGTEGVVLVGNGASNSFYALSSRGAVLKGGAGDDSLEGGVGSGVFGGIGNDRLFVAQGAAYGGDGDDLVIGGTGDSTLWGGAGADTLEGGDGDDVYHMELGDMVQEYLGDDGIDEVRTWVATIFMGALGSVENVVILGDAAAQVRGNSLDNLIASGAGNDSLDGNSGRDTLIGGAGDDDYWLDDTGDRVREQAGGGIDTLHISVGLVRLGAAIENCDLNGSSRGAIGNDQDNRMTTDHAVVLRGMGGRDTIIGSLGGDTLDGGRGGDLMSGEDGQDVYFVDSRRDRLVEAAPGVDGGEDRVLTTLASYVLAANVEDLFALLNAGQSLTGNTLANWIGGGVGNDTLSGADGDDVLQGWAGMDRLTGGTGHDVFLFDTAPSTLNQDTITDFQHLSDRIVLDRDSNSGLFAALATGALASTAFTTSTTPDAFDRIIYRPSTGEVYYDADGSGATEAVLFATLSTRPSLTHADFYVI